MAKHRAVSAPSKRARTVVGGVLAGGALAMITPAGLALAAPSPEHEVATPGDAVGRPALSNPAPGVRIAQRIGDTVFNNDSSLGTAVNGSAVGTAYHDAFGTRGTFKTDPDTGVVTYNGDGTNGYIKGALNAPPGIVVGNALPVRECNIKVANQSGVPSGVRSCT